MKMISKILKRLRNSSGGTYGICGSVRWEIHNYYWKLIKKNYPESPILVASRRKRQEQAQEWLRAHFKLWPQYSGDTTYPVDGKGEYENDASYDLWSNPKRIDLLEFLIMCAEEEGV